MKNYFLLSLIITLIMASSGYSQSSKKATAESFKKQVVGKTFYGKNGLIIKFTNDGYFSGELKSSKDGTKRIINGSWTFNKKEGFCRNLFLTNPAKGITAPRGRECQSVSHKGNGVIIVDGATWKTKK